MKLKKIILAVAAVAACSTALADGAMSKGGTYVGLAGGWGSIDRLDADSMGVSVGSSTGGFGGRVYLGYLMPMTSANWMLGPGFGYSYYANNSYAMGSAYGNSKQSGYGVDLLLNATYMLSNGFNIAVKPGFQYASEKLTYTDTDFAPSAERHRILPEVQLATSWQVFQDKPFFLGASYQYVWGSNTTSQYDELIDTRAVVSSRQMFALNLEYLF